MKKLIAILLCFISIQVSAQRLYVLNYDTVKITGSLNIGKDLKFGGLLPSLIPGTNVTITGTWPNQTINASGGGGGAVSSVFGRTGIVTALSTDYSSFYVPLGRTLTINGVTQDLSVNRSYTISSLPPSGAAGGDLSGTYPNPTVAQFNGQLPSYYLNYNNLTNKPTIYTFSGTTSQLTRGDGTYITNSSDNITEGSTNLYYTTARAALKANVSGQVFTGAISATNLSGTNTGDQTITLTGEATGSGTGSFATTLTNSAVIGKVLTGYVSGSGTVSATDNILQAIQKLNGNIGALVTGVSSFNSRTGAVVPVAGDYASLTETLTNKNLTSGTNTFPTFNQNTTGNAGTATALQTARNINGISFNGTANITITANTPNSLSFGYGFLPGSSTFNGGSAVTVTADTANFPHTILSNTNFSGPGTSLSPVIINTTYSLTNLTNQGTVNKVLHGNASGALTYSGVAIADLTATGTPSSSTFLRGDNTWATPSGGGFSNPMTTLGDIIYGGTSGAATRLAGNITTIQKFLTQTGTGSVSAAPAYFDLFGSNNTFTGGITINSNNGLILTQSGGATGIELNGSTGGAVPLQVNQANGVGTAEVQFGNDGGTSKGLVGMTGGSNATYGNNTMYMYNSLSGGIVFYTNATLAGTIAVGGNYTAAGSVGGASLAIGLAGKLGIVEGTNGRLGQVALVAGTKAITITGLTTSSRAFVSLVSPSSGSLTIMYQGVCTSNTLTLRANIAAGTINTSDVSTVNYIVFN